MKPCEKHAVAPGCPSAGLEAILCRILFRLFYLLFLLLLCLTAGCVNNGAARMGVGFLGGGGAFL